MAAAEAAAADGPRAAGNAAAVAPAPGGHGEERNSAKQAWDKGSGTHATMGGARSTAMGARSSMDSTMTAGADSGAESTADVKWQWLHKTGFRDYKPDESARIETYFQRGDWMMRMKSGKDRHASVREIYFYDMVQYDPRSNSERKIQRTPPPSKYLRLKRWTIGIVQALMAGEQYWWRPKTKEFSEKRRAEVAGEDNPEPVEVYNEGSWAHRIVASWAFNTFSVLMIIINSVYIWADADFNNGTTYLNTEWVFIIFDNIWCTWFLIEAVIRWFAFKSWRTAFADRWFELDVLLVTLMVLETWVLQLIVRLLMGEAGQTNQLNKLSILRGVRLLKLARIARLFKIFPQLVVLVKGMIFAMKSLIYTLLLLFVLTFICAVVFKNFADMNQGLKDIEYDSVGGAFWNLLIFGTFLDSVGQMLNDLKAQSMGYALFFIFYIFVSNLTMLNMLIGVLCEVIARVTDDEKNTLAKAELEASITEIMECYDVEDDHLINLREFKSMMTNPDLKMILQSHDIDHADLAKLEEVLFTETIVTKTGEEKPKPIPFPAFLEKVLQLRGGNTATVGDVVELRGFLQSRFENLESMCKSAANVVKSICDDAPGEASPPTHEKVDSSKIVAPCIEPAMLPGQIGPVSPTSEHDAPLSTKDFQDAVLAQLSEIRQRQDVMQADFKLFQTQLQELQQVPAAAAEV